MKKIFYPRIVVQVHKNDLWSINRKIWHFFNFFIKREVILNPEIKTMLVAQEDLM